MSRLEEEARKQKEKEENNQVISESEKAEAERKVKEEAAARTAEIAEAKRKADEYEAEPTKGQLNKKFGLYVERPFYIISAMSEHRYLDLINNRNMVIKTRNGRSTQTWYFH